jgi:hypothetical protein
MSHIQDIVLLHRVADFLIEKTTLHRPADERDFFAEAGELISIVTKGAASGSAVRRLREAVEQADADRADELADAQHTGERPDLWDDQVEVYTDDLREVLRALDHPMTLALLQRAAEALEAAARQFESIAGETVAGGVCPIAIDPSALALSAATNARAVLVEIRAEIARLSPSD